MSYFEKFLKTNQHADLHGTAHCHKNQKLMLPL